MDDRAGVRPLTQFTRNIEDVLSELKESRQPMTLTVDGKPALVVIDVQAWHDLIDRLEREAATSGISRGLADAEAGRVDDLDSVFARVSTGRA